MGYYPTENAAGIQPIYVTSAVQNHPLGKIVRASDETLGGGEFIYLLGAVDTVAGLAYSYNATTFQTVVLPVTANLGTPIAIAMSENTAGRYGWYQIEGLATVLKSAVAVAPQAKVFISATAGRLMPTATAGRAIIGAKYANLASVTSTVSSAIMLISRPRAQGQIT